jgi:ADP-heptose:LPS heptosyltransferase
MKTLVIHLGALGDLLLALPAVRRFTNQKPVFLCQSETGRLLTALGLAEAFLPSEGPLAARLYAPPPDPVLSRAFIEYRNILLFSFSRELEQNLRAVFSGPLLRVPPRPAPEIREPVPEWLKARVAEALPGKAPDAGAPDILTAASPGISWRPGPENRLILHPGSGSPRKCWPAARFAALGKALSARGFAVSFLLGPAETRLAGILAGLGVPAQALWREDSLVRAAATLAQAAGFIGNDSGITHLAAFLGLPTVAVFGPSDPVRWAPPGTCAALLRPALECAPCHETAKTNCASPRCLMDTEPEEVLHALLTLFEKGRARQRASV